MGAGALTVLLQLVLLCSWTCQLIKLMPWRAVFVSCCLQVFVDRAFSSCVRCLATDADSDVVWAGDEAGRLAVLRWAAGRGCRRGMLLSAQAAPDVLPSVSAGSSFAC